MHVYLRYFIRNLKYISYTYRITFNTLLSRIFLFFLILIINIKKKLEIKFCSL